MLPLVVDLDGTLLDSDLLVEAAFAYVRRNPHKLFAPLFWLLSGGKAGLKSQLARQTQIDAGGLPYNQQLLKRLREEKQKGRRLILATAADERQASQVADHLGLFDEVLASNSANNLSGCNKATLLVSRFGHRGFDYVGNAHADLPVWAAARHAYLVNPETGVIWRMRRAENVAEVLLTRGGAVRSWARALRLHQWLKNTLLFVPLLSAHRIGDLGLLVQGGLAFILFGLTASSVYLLNDLLDLHDDRNHAGKRHRPFAAGTLSVKSGVLACPLLLLVAFVGAGWLLPPMFVLILAIYYLLTLSYSLWLKRLLMVDVVVLAMLYTLRIVAGAMAFGLNISFWLLAFSMFIFLSLAFVKRAAELRVVRHSGRSDKAHGRNYVPQDLEVVSSMGAAAGYIAVLVLALYIQDQTTQRLYRHPQLIWLACPLLLFWVGRIWVLTHRGEMHDDPVVFALKDRVSLLVGGLFALVFILAAYL